MNPIKNKTAACILVFFLFFTFIYTGHCQDPENVLAEFPASEKSLQTVKETVKAYETGNWELLRENVAEDAIFYNLGSFDSLNLDQTINYWKEGRKTAVPDLSGDGMWLPVSVKEGPRKGDWVLHWGSNTLAYPNGDTIQFPYHIATKMENGKATEVHFYYDNSRIIRAMGYAIDPPLKETDEEDKKWNN